MGADATTTEPANRQMPAHWSHGPDTSQRPATLLYQTLMQNHTLANQEVANKITKYEKLVSKHIFYPDAMESLGC